MVLRTVESVEHLLLEFDVDCCAVAFDPRTRRVYMTPRARRAYEYGANILDSRFNSSSYATRLHKYARRGFAVVVPGFDRTLVSPQLLEGSYVYVEDHELLLQITSVGRPGAKESTVHFADRSARIRYERCDEAKVVDGLAQLVVADRGEMRSARLPKLESCEKCNVVTADMTAQSGSPVLLHSGVPKTYHLIWAVALPEDGWPELDCDSDEDGCEDLAGYTCTPLARAYDLLSHLLDQQLLENPDGHLKSGVASRFSARVAQQNGEVCAATCRRHYDRALACKRRVQFVWDLVSCHANFESLAGILDASKIPTLAASGEWQKTCGVPKLLTESITAAPPRQPIEIDWLRGVY